MFDLLENNDNYADSPGSLWQFKRDEQNMTNAGKPDNVTTDYSSSFKYKSGLIENKNAATIVVPLKYLSSLFRPLEILLINCKIHLELNWTKDCVMSNIAGNTAF